MKSSLCISRFVKQPLLILLAVCSLNCSSAFAAVNDGSRTVKVSYVIRSLGLDIGTVSAKTVGTARDNDFHADVNVNARFWLFGFILTSSESASIRDGKLVSYHKTVETKGHRKEISGNLNGEIFKIVVREDGKAEHKEFSTSDYVTTNMEYPEITLTPGEARKIRVVDLENSGIVDRQYRQVSEEQAEISGLGSRVVASDFADRNSEGRRWTAIVDGLPIVLRQEGKEKTGLFNPSYKVMKTKISIDP